MFNALVDLLIRIGVAAAVGRKVSAPGIVVRVVVAGVDVERLGEVACGAVGRGFEGLPRRRSHMGIVAGLASLGCRPTGGAHESEWIPSQESSCPMVEGVGVLVVGVERLIMVEEVVV